MPLILEIMVLVEDASAGVGVFMFRGSRWDIMPQVVVANAGVGALFFGGGTLSYKWWRRMQQVGYMLWRWAIILQRWDIMHLPLLTLCPSFES